MIHLQEIKRISTGDKTIVNVFENGNHKLTTVALILRNLHQGEKRATKFSSLRLQMNKDFIDFLLLFIRVQFNLVQSLILFFFKRPFQVLQRVYICSTVFHPVPNCHVLSVFKSPPPVPKQQSPFIPFRPISYRSLPCFGHISPFLPFASTFILLLSISSCPFRVYNSTSPFPLFLIFHWYDHPVPSSCSSLLLSFPLRSRPNKSKQLPLHPFIYLSPSLAIPFHSCQLEEPSISPYAFQLFSLLSRLLSL